MNGGLLEQIGQPEDVYRRPRTAFVAEFVGAANRLPARIVRTDAGGRYTVALDGVGERVASGPAGLSMGTQTILLIRPEELRFDADRSVSGGLTATVVDVSFLGAQRTGRLDSSQLGPLTATTSAGSEAPAPGAEVAVNWDDRHSWAVPL